MIEPRRLLAVWACAAACGPSAGTDGESADAGDSSTGMAETSTETGSSESTDTGEETGPPIGCEVVTTETLVGPGGHSRGGSCELAYQAGDTYETLELITLDLGESRTLSSNMADDSGQLAFAPGTDALVYREADGRLLVRPDRGWGEATEVSTDVSHFVITSDGQWVVFVTGSTPHERLGTVWSAPLGDPMEPRLLADHAWLMHHEDGAIDGYHPSANWDGSGRVIVTDTDDTDVHGTLRWVSLDGAQGETLDTNAWVRVADPQSGRVFYQREGVPDATYHVAFTKEARDTVSIPITVPDLGPYENYYPTGDFTPNGERLVVLWYGDSVDVGESDDHVIVIDLAGTPTVELEIPCVASRRFVLSSGVLCFHGPDQDLQLYDFDGGDVVLDSNVGYPVRIDDARWVYEHGTELRLLDLGDPANAEIQTLTQGQLEFAFDQRPDEEVRWLRTEIGSSWGVFDLVANEHYMPLDAKPLSVAGEGRAIVYVGLHLSPLPP